MLGDIIMDCNKPFKVCTLCLTFNQASFISETMDGFCIQKTNFPVVYLIIDDASTDGEIEVINQYLENNFILDDENTVRKEETEDYRLLYAQHKTNKNCFFAVCFLKYNHYRKKSKVPYIFDWVKSSQYYALCEGDDYWTDSQKLKEQVDFMDNNPDFSMCFTDAQDYYEDKKKFGAKQSSKYGCENAKLENASKNDTFYSILLGKSRIQTLSVLIRSELILERKEDPVDFYMGDTQVWLDMSQIGKIKYINRCSCVYRINTGSTSRDAKTKLLFGFSMYEMRIYYCLKYNKPIPDIVQKKYNTKLYEIKVRKSNLGREPLYEAFPMNTIQDYIYSKSENNAFCRAIASFMLWIEKNNKRFKAFNSRF